ncbi:hypothetical protein JB92DRAFT_3139371 [Gautieria morchelliformis]|nr:hypothetical protein JB92DRAFT_3139371 [Gautieria morchelliformis]
MITRIAEELLAMILAPSLTVPYGQLTSKSPCAFGSNDLVPSSSALLVCKRWLRVATPLLYETVVIRSTAQSLALASALQSSPSFARYIKNVRLEGAYQGTYDILSGCKNLSTLVLLLNVYSDSRTSCLSRALFDINPTHVFLFDSGSIDNAKLRKLFTTLCEVIPTWKNLTTFGFPYSTHIAGSTRVGLFTRRTMLSEALIQSKSLRLVHCDEPGDYINVNTLQPLTRSPTITIRIMCDLPRQDDLPSGTTVEAVKAAIAKNKQLVASSFLLVNRAPPSVFFQSYGRLIIHEHVRTLPSNPTNTPQKPSVRDGLAFSSDTVMKVSDVIWGDIFALATVPSEGHTVCECHRLRRNLSLVCQKFSRVVTYLFYTHPLIRSGDALQLLLKTVFRSPFLGHLVLELSVYDPYNPWAATCMVADLCALFPFLTSLRHLYISRSYCGGALLMPSHALTLLATAAGDSLLSLKLDFRLDTSLSPNVLNSFKKLTKIDMCLPCDFSDDNTGLQHDTLATLQELHLTGSSSFLETLSVLRLPQLKIVVFSSTARPPIDAFMAACGAQVEELHFSGTADFASLFWHAPKLRLLRWGPMHSQRRCREEIAAAFENFGSHATLQKLKLAGLPGFPGDRCEVERCKVTLTIFGLLHFANFPSLNALQFEHYRWPEDERSIQKDVIPAMAIHIKQRYSIEITDLTGKPWRPRVQQKGKPLLPQMRGMKSLMRGPLLSVGKMKY